MPLPVPGALFRGLKIHSMLGEGAMGAAWLASNPVLRVPVVIKTYTAAPPQGDLFREAHLAARVASPHVVGVVDAGVEDGVPFVVQRYIDGIDGAELLEWMAPRAGRVPLNAAVRFIADGARGLHAIHQAGVVHRDIKPANLFLGGNGTALLGDFGIALDRSRRASSGGAAGGEIAGTPLYMAPEVWQNQPVTRAADIYSLGATAHLFAVAEAPFVAPTMPALAVAHVSQPYVAPRAADPLHAYYFAVIERMLRKAPTERYASCEDVVGALARIAEPPPRYTVVGDAEAIVGSLRVRLEHGDLARAEADVIVSAANTRLTMEVGVARALLQSGGENVAREALAAAPARMGDVVWTGAGSLRARFVAHAVAALDGAICVGRCTLRALFGAEQRRQRSIAFPALGSGVGDVPMSLSAMLTLEAVRTFASFEPSALEEVAVVLYDRSAFDAWREVLSAM